jgi:hypothetical protein
MKRSLIRGLGVLIDVVWFLFAALLIWRLLGHWQRQRGENHLYHVTIAGGGIIYRDYWTTCPPPPFHADVPWYECLKFTNEN